MIAIFDTETTGVWGGKGKKKLKDNDPNAPRIASIACVAYSDDLSKELCAVYKLVRPDGWVMPAEASAVNGLTTERLMAEGLPLEQVMNDVQGMFVGANLQGGFNVAFDTRMVNTECARARRESLVDVNKTRCLMLAMAEVIREPTPWGDFAWPKLSKAFKHCYGVDFTGSHDALVDVRATRDIWAWARYKGWVSF